MGMHLAHNIRILKIKLKIAENWTWNFGLLNDLQIVANALFARAFLLCSLVVMRWRDDPLELQRAKAKEKVSAWEFKNDPTDEYADSWCREVAGQQRPGLDGGWRRRGHVKQAFGL